VHVIASLLPGFCRTILLRLKIVAGLLPKDVNLKVSNLDDLTDEQLLNKLNSLTEMAGLYWPGQATLLLGQMLGQSPQQTPP
jgi:hypothetical protein